MKPFTLLYSYSWKIAGICISIGGIILLVTQKILPAFKIFHSFNSEQHFQLFTWIILLGIYSISFSREKNDDERVQFIRGKAMLAGFSIIIGTIQSLSVVGTIHPDISFNAGSDLYILAAFALICYQIYFNIGLYYDKAWNYEKDETLMASFKFRKFILLLYIIIVIAGIIVLRFR